MPGGATVAVGVGAPAAKTAVESSTRVVGWWLAGCAGNTENQKLCTPKAKLTRLKLLIRVPHLVCAVLWIRIGFNADMDPDF